MDKKKKSASRPPASAGKKPGKTVSPKKPAEQGKAPYKPPAVDFPVVAIGASAGGFEAFEHLLKNLPANTGMAFVFVQHLAPAHESMLPQLLARVTKMPVQEVKDGMRVEPDKVYVAPPNMSIASFHGVLNLMPREHAWGVFLPIDYFMRSLAEDIGERAVGVILSGTASDGTAGIKAIKARGGITFSQDPKTAKYDNMPRSAISTGHVDFVLPPENIALELGRLGTHPYLALRKAAIRPVEEDFPEGAEAEGALSRIFLLLRDASGVDFTGYKQTTIRRRVKRRMALHRVERLKDYLAYLRHNPVEVKELYQDILISVTSFFREPEIFKALKETVLPAIMKARTTGSGIRIWVPGCATGEEAYSFAIAVIEFLGEMSGDVAVQVFATDIDERALEKARAGRFDDTIKADVSEERLRRFFTQFEGGYTVNKNIRDMCVFARQDITRDPPFSNLDLVSCRNVLIYLDAALQKKVLQIFHYSLKPAGYLVLGSSETIGASADLFTMVDKRQKIYAKKAAPSRAVRLPAGISPREEPQAGKRDPAAWERFDLHKKADSILLGKYVPPGVVVNENMEAVRFYGQTGRFLEHEPGDATLNIIKMARPGLLFDLREAAAKALKEGIYVKKEGIHVKHDGETIVTGLEITPITDPVRGGRFLFIVFQEAGKPAKEEAGKEPRIKVKKGARKEPEESRTMELQHELSATKEYLNSVIAEKDRVNDELSTVNEEAQSSNEELQSINEELETAKEELQSTNEELATLNEELENRNAELVQTSDDLNNLLTSLSIPMLMLSRDIKIRRFTPAAEKVFNLIPADIGRPLSDIRANIDVPELSGLIAEVMDTMSARELETADRDGRWHLVRLSPYRTSERRVDGVVLILIDISAIKTAMGEAEAARNYAESIISSVKHPLLVLDMDLKVVSASRAFYETFKVPQGETIGNQIARLGNGQWAIPDLIGFLEKVASNDRPFDDYLVRHDFKDIGHKAMRLSGRRIKLDKKEERALILLIIEDVT